jgi:hypothetical protein
MPGSLKVFPTGVDNLDMTSSVATAPAASRTRRAPLFAAFEKAAHDGVSRRTFAVKTGLTSAEIWMLERATGVRLAA